MTTTYRFHQEMSADSEDGPTRSCAGCGHWTPSWAPHQLLCSPWTVLMNTKPLRADWWEFRIYPHAKSSDMCVCLPTQSCPILCDPMDCSPPGSSVHGIFQARILEWVAISSSRGSSRPRDQTHVSCVSCIGRWVLYHWATWGSLNWYVCPPNHDMLF